MKYNVISPDKCKTETRFEYIDLLSLTGVFGIHKKLEFLDLYERGFLKHEVFFDEDDVLTVEISSPVIEALIIKLIRPEEIYIDYFRLHEGSKGGNLGFRRLQNQIQAAIRKNFKSIKLWAYGSISEYPAWEGYIVWAKYGFLMYRKDETYEFEQLMLKERLQHCTILNHLVKTKEGTCVWKHLGKDWKGEFQLFNNSPSRQILASYAEERGLTYGLTL